MGVLGNLLLIVFLAIGLTGIGVSTWENKMVSIYNF